MARSRMIRPEFWDDEKLSKISRDARLTFIGTWNHSDDYGVVKGNHRWLKNKIYPYDNTTDATFDKWMDEITELGMLIPFSDNGESYYFIKNFLKHQKVNRPSKQRNPEPPQQTLEQSVSAHVVLTDETETETEVKQKPKGIIYSEEFLKFYSYYPRKISKAKAFESWVKLQPDLNICVAAIKMQKQNRKALKSANQFCAEWKHPATWLNQCCWDDEPIEIEKKPGTF